MSTSSHEFITQSVLMSNKRSLDESNECSSDSSFECSLDESNKWSDDLSDVCSLENDK